MKDIEKINKVIEVLDTWFVEGYHNKYSEESAVKIAKEIVEKLEGGNDGV